MIFAVQRMSQSYYYEGELETGHSLFSPSFLGIIPDYVLQKIKVGCFFMKLWPPLLYWMDDNNVKFSIN